MLYLYLIRLCREIVVENKSDNIIVVNQKIESSSWFQIFKCGLNTN